MLSPLRKKRFLSELTIYDLSQRTGIDPCRISLIERDYKMPRDEEREKIALALGCDVSDIFPTIQELSPC